MKLYYFLSNYISHKKAGMGNIHCLRQAGVELVSHPQLADVVVVHDEAPALPLYYQHVPCLKDKYVVAFSVWETTQLPQIYQENLSQVNEVWTASEWTASIYRKYHPKVSIFPHLILPPQTAPSKRNQVATALKAQPNDYHFYTICDPGNPRKNIWALISAFQRLQPSFDQRTYLIIKQYARTRPELGQLPNVISLTGNWEEAQILDLHALGDCYLSTHTSEAWGLGLSEAMAMNNPVIATGASGNMEFMTAANSFPIPAHKRKLFPWEVLSQPKLLNENMSWYEVDPVIFMETMKMVHRTPKLSISPNQVLQSFSMENLINKFRLWKERLSSLN